MRAINDIIAYNSGTPTDPSETHWVFSNVQLLIDLGEFKKGFVCPTAILHTDTPRLILIEPTGKQFTYDLKYSV
jgi:hypothetical protein